MADLPRWASSQSSGDAGFDDLALRHIQGAVRFPPPPTAQRHGFRYPSEAAEALASHHGAFLCARHIISRKLNVMRRARLWRTAARARPPGRKPDAKHDAPFIPCLDRRRRADATVGLRRRTRLALDDGRTGDAQRRQPDPAARVHLRPRPAGRAGRTCCRDGHRPHRAAYAALQRHTAAAGRAYDPVRLRRGALRFRPAPGAFWTRSTPRV
jgi:hypothetical protein